MTKKAPMRCHVTAGGRFGWGSDRRGRRRRRRRRRRR